MSVFDVFGRKSRTNPRETSAQAPIVTKPEDSTKTADPLQSPPVASKPEEEQTMSTTAAPTNPTKPETPVTAPVNAAAAIEPASIADLRKAFPNDADFVLTAFESKLSIAQATAMHAPLQAQRDQTAKVTAAAAESLKGRPPIAGSITAATDANAAGGGKGEAGADGDPIAAWNDRVDNYVAQHKCTKGDAIKKLVHSEPALHQAYLRANVRSPRGSERR